MVEGLGTVIDIEGRAGVATRFELSVGGGGAVAGHRRGGLLAALAAIFEQGILRQLLGQHAFEFEVGERKQPDRLLQLRRHHQRLRLPEVEARRERHGRNRYSEKPSPR